jgi:2-keto-3-deoxy-L-rhamnonate aldolase RhmA
VTLHKRCDGLLQANASVTVIAMIEDPEAIDVIDGIVSVEGLDEIFIGRGDLTVAMGANGPTDPWVRSAAGGIIAAGREVRECICIMVDTVKEAADWRSLGADSFIVASDQGFMREAAGRTRTEFAALVGARCPRGEVEISAEIPIAR